ncbi:putative transcription elongation factor S-II, central domain-containing protein [Helianthus anomalus]
METMLNNTGSEKLLLPTKRKAPTETLSPSSVDKQVAQMEPHVNKRPPQLQPMLRKPISQRVQTPKNRTATQEVSPKVQNGSSEPVRSKMRETLAAALSVGIQNEEKPNYDNNNSPSEASKAHVDPQPDVRTEGQNGKDDGQEPRYNYVMTDADGSFGDTFFVKDDLLQGNGLSWAWEEDNGPEPGQNGGTNGIENNVKSPEELASRIEAELFKLFDGVNKKYKEKGRSLMFNLKDRNNPELRENVLSGVISPERLCSMTAEELASKQLSEWRIAKAEELDKMIVLQEADVDVRRLVKKTHKGEYQVEMEQDDGVSVEVSVESTSFTKFPPTKKKTAHEAEEKEITIPVDGTDFMQELIVDEFKDDGFLLPIVSVDEFMESLDSEPPFENLPTDSETKPDIVVKTDSEIVGRVDQPKAESNEAFLDVKTSDVSVERKTVPVSSVVIGEKMWEGELQLTISSSVSAIGLFRSGEKTSTKEWPDSMEIKGRVRLDAFKKFLQELPMSRTRAVMVVHFVLKDSSSEIHRANLSEAVDSYVTDERLGFGEPNPGVELYFCPPHMRIIEMLCKYLSKNQTDVLRLNDNGLIGVIVWRRPHISFNNTPSSSQHKHYKKHRRHGNVNANTNLNFTPKSVNRVQPAVAQPNNDDDDDDDDIPPGFGPGVATAAQDDDDLPEFSFSGNSNSAGQRNPAQVGFRSKPTQVNPSAPVDQMRQLIYRYGQTATGDAGAKQINKPWNIDNEDDDMPEWQPHLHRNVRRPEVPPVHHIQPPLAPNMVNQVMPPIGQVMRPQMTQPQVNVLQNIVRWPPPASGPPVLPPNAAISGPQYVGQWRLDAARSRGF